MDFLEKQCLGKLPSVVFPYAKKSLPLFSTGAVKHLGTVPVPGNLSYLAITFEKIMFGVTNQSQFEGESPPTGNLTRYTVHFIILVNVKSTLI